MKIPILDENQLFKHLHTKNNPFYNQYYAFYSSWFDGIIKDPSLMLLPMDDHMVHRGDGVFEAVKAENRAVYLLDQHLDRLFCSAEKIALYPALTRSEMKTIILETLRIADKNNAMLRIFLSRGPGNFSVNPYDSVGAQFYVMVTQLNVPAHEKYLQGVSVGKSTVPSKEPWMAQIKSCNYLHNVLMKKEAVDKHFEYVIAVDTQDYILEGYTENIMMVDPSGQLVHPPLQDILKGITMVRVCELAAKEGIPTVERPISVNELFSATEVIMTGTSLDILPVSRFENYSVPLGPIAKKLRMLMRADIMNGPYRSEF